MAPGAPRDAPDRVPAPGRGAVARMLARVPERLAALRAARGASLAELAEATGISRSTLSRLETGHRVASLRLLLPVALAHGVTLDELVGLSGPASPGAGWGPLDRLSRPLTRGPVAVVPWKVVHLPSADGPPAVLPVHPGRRWYVVISGRLCLATVDSRDVLGAGESAEIAPGVPHWTGPTEDGPVQVLVLAGGPERSRGRGGRAGPGSRPAR